MNNLTTVKNSINIKTNAKILVETLIEQGVDSIFGYPGASVLSIYNELFFKKEITHYLVRHEQAAIHAAEGYARLSGKVGVVLVTSGPGFTNTVTGIANAYTDSTPLVILAGDVSSESVSGKIFQKIDIESMVQSCTKKIYTLTEKDNIKTVLEDAFCVANTGNKGPVVIILARKFLESKYTNSISTREFPKFNNENLSVKINRFSSILNISHKPIILVGGGCVDSAQEVMSFADKLGCPIVSTLMGIGIYPSENENYLGMIGINGTYQANSALNHADLIISLGTSFSDRSTCKNNNFSQKTKIINVNIKPISKTFELEIITDVKKFINLYLQKTKNINIQKSWSEQINLIKSEMCTEEKKTERLNSSYVLKTISDYTEDFEPVVITDVGQHQMLTAQFFNFNKPRKFITSGGLGTMGFGLPASIGAYVANPNNLILNITGDGSFQMNLQELATCREHNIPIKIIIMNNGYLGMVRQMQEKIYNNRYQVEMTNPDFVKIAEAYDLFAIRVTSKEDLKPSLEKAIKHNGTAIIDIMIDLFENI